MRNARIALRGILKAIYFGFLGGTAIIHITPLVKQLIRDFENRYLSEKHHESETATLLIVVFLTMIMEPVVYIVNLAVSLDKHGPVGLLWLAPVLISQSFGFAGWMMRRRANQRKF